MTVTPSGSSSSASSTPSQAPDQTPKKSEGISQSTIIGLSVSGGVALIGLISFVIWKFTRKRFTDDDFDSEYSHPSLSSFPRPCARLLGAPPMHRNACTGYRFSVGTRFARR